LYNNFEYGVLTSEKQVVESIKNDLLSYGALGAVMTSEKISAYCSILDEMQELLHLRKKSSKKDVDALQKVLEKADEELLAAKLRGGKLHPIFEATIEYILQKHGSLPTKMINNLIQEIHPDLCDESVDRVIDGVHFGKKWKHTVRTAQQHLKHKGKIKLLDGNWLLVK